MWRGVAAVAAVLARVAARSSCARNVTRIAWPREPKIAGRTVKHLVDPNRNYVRYSFHKEAKHELYLPAHYDFRMNASAAARFVRDADDWPAPWFWEAHWRFVDFGAAAHAPFFIGILLSLIHI